MLCGYRFQKFIIAKVFFATALYYMLKQLTRMTQNFLRVLNFAVFVIIKKRISTKKITTKKFTPLWINPNANSK